MLLTAARSQLLVVDVQERLTPAMSDMDAALANIARLATAARTLDVPITISEQYPKGLGPTLPAVRETCGPDVPVFPKLHFSCARDAALAERVASLNRKQIIVCGIEAHVCVLQSALDFAARGADVFVVVDAIASRRADSKDIALRRLERANVTLATTEMVIFEQLEMAGTAPFKALAPLFR